MADAKTTIEEVSGKKNIGIENVTDSLTDVAGGMGRHLGVFSCTILVYLLFYPTLALY